MTLSERERRLAHNEALFREVNERIEAMADHLGSDVPYEFLCECADADCTFRLSLPIPVYESVRADPTQFVVLPLHFSPEIEEVTHKEQTYWIVRKVGEAAAYVEQLDPRGR